MNHSPEVIELIESSKLFPDSALLNPEKAKSATDKAEDHHGKTTSLV